MNTALLLGGSGFLGRHIRRALAADWSIHAPSRQECDLVAIDPTALVSLLRRERPDAVVVAAGRIVGSGYDFVQAHAVVAAKLVEAVTAGAPQARLVKIGSAAEYGAVPYGTVVAETQPTRPVSEYGVSHLAATRLMELAAESGRLDAVVLRVFNPVGPGLTPGNVLGQAASLIRAAMEHGDEHISLGLLDAYRDFVDVRDVADAVRAALSCGSLRQRVFNIGSGRATAVKDAVAQLAGVAGFPGEIRDGAFTAAAGRSTGVPWMCADIRCGADQLGWLPAHPLTDSLAALWREVGGADRNTVAAVASDQPQGFTTSGADHAQRL
ncbi:NAD-dependent epimerase/dehydratase family protein [Micromonospora radicis]|uniref:SDR family oxidoreductase n=1 Tax=Micromonospora radicis TaxID=1894971 RepID=A0A418MY91_9ACTN|nr:NAD-dependent epimerase/dehydratase family protein [Micromonospora radicis]RIV39639.1 SDR family oxidoreductase [Micromonospora radicis]